MHSTTRQEHLDGTRRADALQAQESTGDLSRELGTIGSGPEDEPYLHFSIRPSNVRKQMQNSPEAVASLVLEALEHEKARISRDLHDEVVQLLFAMKIDCAWLRQNLTSKPAAACEKLASMQRLLEGSADSLRRIVANLRPAVLDQDGFAGAVRRLVRDFTESSGVRCELDMSPQLELPDPYASAAFRIIQESLANVRKHAAASSVKVWIALEGSVLSVSVRDDGKGFSPGVPRRRDAMGLDGVRERTRLLGGWMQVCSAPGAGTLVAARLTLASEGQNDAADALAGGGGVLS